MISPLNPRNQSSIEPLHLSSTEASKKKESEKDKWLKASQKLNKMSNNSFIRSSKKPSPDDKDKGILFLSEMSENVSQTQIIKRSDSKSAIQQFVN
jgi:hypothetical protein